MRSNLIFSEFFRSMIRWPFIFHNSVRTHIVHLSTAEALPTIRHLREQIGDRLTVETCHHYLTLASEDVPHGRVEFKCCPPIRDRYNREQLWKAIRSHDINLVVSDHSPSTPDVKLLNEGPQKGNFLRSWGGISSIQFGMLIVPSSIGPAANCMSVYGLQDSRCSTQTAWDVVWASSKCIDWCVSSQPNCAVSMIAKDALPKDSMQTSASGIRNLTSWWHRRTFISGTRPIRTWVKYWMESFMRPLFAVKLPTTGNGKETNSAPLAEWSSESHKKKRIKRPTTKIDF